MPELVSITDQMEEVGPCVIIPTYNNANTLGQVITDVRNYCRQIIVVNDGSTDHTAEILKAHPDIDLVSYAPNRGKGWALRKAFARAIERGFAYAIAIDSDGQHFAKDLPVFLEKIRQEPGALIIGARNMNQESVPGKSSFGYKFSNFWFRVETGIKCPDTQSGFRLYPLEPINKMRFFTRKYEFEIEVLVRLAWKGIKVDAVPITVYYAPKAERVSHFRPTLDFIRISILNTLLVLIAFLYIKPRNFFRTLFNREKFKQMMNDHLFNPHHSARVKAISIGLGVFMGIVPIWGFQLVSAIFLAVLFRLNKPLVIIAANISIPPMIPLIIFLSYKVGAFWLGPDAQALQFNRSISLDTIRHNLQQYIFGSITLAVLAGIVFGLLAYILLKLFTGKTPAAA